MLHVIFSIIGTDIKFNHTNSAICSSGPSRGLFTSASDYASAQWRLVLHILVTCSPHVNKCWVMRAIYGIRWGWSRWPITIQHVWSQWGFIDDGHVRQEVKRPHECPEALEIFFNGLEKYLQMDRWLKRMTCWSVLSLIWCHIMAVHKCYAFRLCPKYLLSPTLMPAVRCWRWVYSLGTW